MLYTRCLLNNHKILEGNFRGFMAYSHCRTRTPTETRIRTFYTASDLYPDPFPLVFV